MYKLAAFVLLGVSPVLAQGPFRRSVNEHANNLAPFVSSPQIVVDKMLEVAGLKRNEVLYDLGSGDGRVLIAAAQKYGVRGVGVEISEVLVKATENRLRQLKLDDRVRVMHGDIMTVDLSQADVVTMYLETKSNEMLKPRLEKQLRPGARVISHDFEVRGWKPNRVELIEAYNRPHKVYIYEMPPRPAN